MNYDNLLNKDLRKRNSAPAVERHIRMRWAMLAAGCAVIGVVLASTGTSVEDPILVDNHPVAEKEIAADVQQVEQSTNSIKLKLPSPTKHITNDTNSIKKSSSSQQADDNTNDSFIDNSNTLNWKTLTVKNGQSLSILFDKAKVKPAQLLELMKLGSATKELLRLHPGDKVKIASDANGTLLALDYQIDIVRYLQVARVNGQLTAEILKHNIEVRHTYASGEIESSLFLSSAKAGLSQNLTMELANIFGWDIDFVLDIRKGDTFTVIYEERFKNGNKIKDGNILAAEFINRGKSHRALRYTDPVTNRTGYYSPDGHSLRKAFLRSPVKFSRISSRFTTKRYHPILHRFRSHKGVDYAAGRGTPIRASGDGKIIYKGRKGGYGRTIVIKHGSRYSTLYAHMNSYNKKTRNGGRVKQGQVIGYVGSSGLASGPHLHYEFRVNGVHRNPLTVKFPSTKPIPKRYRDNFELTTQSYVAQLDVLSQNTLALNNH